MSKKPVKYALEPDRLAPLTQQQKAEIDALKSPSESEIDYSDIPPLTDEFWKNAVRNPFYRPTKSTTTVRIDTDVLLWLKSQGKGYQTRINAILRVAMLKALHKTA
ncbi:MAG: BrnA antitoxin family protein [Gammaproteobacteria bacterium]